MDVIAKLRALDARVSALERENAELRGRLSNLPVRWPDSRDARINVKVTVVATAGRKRYTGTLIQYTEGSGSDPALSSSNDPAAYKFYNKLESTNGTPFLVVNDEVEIWRDNGLWLCAEIPRGFV